MKVTFFTNLDAPQWFIRDLNFRVEALGWDGPLPEVGDAVEFPFERAGRRLAFSLEVKSRSLEVLKVPSVRNVTHWTVRNVTHWTFELHIPKGHPCDSIASWTTYYQRHVEGRDV